MPPKRDWHMRLADMRSALAKIDRYTAGLDQAAFLQDERTQDAVIRNLEILGEAAARIPQEVRAQHPALPWDEISAMRNVLIHEYFGADLAIVWQTVRQELPKLRKLLESLGS